MKSSDCFYNSIYEVLNNTGEIMSHKTHLVFSQPVAEYFMRLISEPMCVPRCLISFWELWRWFETCSLRTSRACCTDKINLFPSAIQLSILPINVFAHTLGNEIPQLNSNSPLPRQFRCEIPTIGEFHDLFLKKNAFILFTYPVAGNQF